MIHALLGACCGNMSFFFFFFFFFNLVKKKKIVLLELTAKVSNVITFCFYLIMNSNFSHDYVFDSFESQFFIIT